MDGLGDSKPAKIPIQIEKKCFFIRPVINDVSWWQKLCCFPVFNRTNEKDRAKGKKQYSKGTYASLSGSKGGQVNDHYQDVVDKFPDEVHKQLMPLEHEKKLNNISEKAKKDMEMLVSP